MVVLARMYLFVLFLLEKAVIAKSNIILDVKPWDDETGVWYVTMSICMSLCVSECVCMSLCVCVLLLYVCRMYHVFQI